MLNIARSGQLARPCHQFQGNQVTSNVASTSKPLHAQVDLDVAGTDNSLLHTSTSQETVTQPWFDDDWGQEVLQQKITREYITNESDAKLKYPANFQGGYAIVNQDKLNKWSNPRGYSIHPGFSPIHNVRMSTTMLQAFDDNDYCRRWWGPSDSRIMRIGRDIIWLCQCAKTTSRRLRASGTPTYPERRLSISTSSLTGRA